MKRFICIFSAFMLLVGCVKNDPVNSHNQVSQAEIAFDCPVVGAKTKSVPELSKYPDDMGFRVWAYYSETETPSVDVENRTLNNLYIDGVVFENEGKLWGPNDGNAYYWPGSGYLNFIAYAPSAPVGLPNAASASITHEGLQLTGYVVPDSADEDLLISQIYYAQTNPGEGVGALINFTHALTSLEFKIKSGIIGQGSVATDIRVTKIELLNVRSVGSFSQSMTVDGWSASRQMADGIGWEVADITKDFVAYDDTYTAESYVMTKSDGDAGVLGENEWRSGILLTDEYQSFHDLSLTEVQAQTYAVTNLLLLPQQLNDDVTLRVTYDMTHELLDDLNESESAIWIENQVREVAMTDLGIDIWLRGKKYTYNITMYLDKIVCAPEVNEWIPGETVKSDIEDMTLNAVEMQ